MKTLYNIDTNLTKRQKKTIEYLKKQTLFNVAKHNYKVFNSKNFAYSKNKIVQHYDIKQKKFYNEKDIKGETFFNLMRNLNSEKVDVMEYPDISFVLQDNPNYYKDSVIEYIIIDIDDCIDEKDNLSNIGKYIVSNTNAYTEVSQSGSGLHLIMAVSSKFRYKLSMLQKSGLMQVNNRTLKVEVYAHNHHIVLTGNTYQGKKTIKGINDKDELFINEQKLVKVLCKLGMISKVVSKKVLHQNFTKN